MYIMYGAVWKSCPHSQTVIGGRIAFWSLLLENKIERKPHSEVGGPYTVFTNGRQPGTSARPNMESRRFKDRYLFSCKLWPINWPTYVEIIGHLKAISLMRQFFYC